MTWRQRHTVDLRGIPRRDDQASAVRRSLDLFNYVVDLIDAYAVGATPVAPLRAVNATKLTFLIGPLVPNRNSVFVEITHVRFAAQKPEQLVND